MYCEVISTFILYLIVYMLFISSLYPLTRFAGHALALAAATFALLPVEGLPAGALPAAAERAVGFGELSRAYVALAIQGDLRRAPALFQDSVGGGAAVDSDSSRTQPACLDSVQCDAGLR